MFNPRNTYTSTTPGSRVGGLSVPDQYLLRGGIGYAVPKLRGVALSIAGRDEGVPARDLIHEYLEFVDDVVDELDSREELNYIHKILEHGSGADRQLRVFEETGDLKKVVDYIIGETEAGLEEDPAAVRKVG